MARLASNKNVATNGDGWNGRRVLSLLPPSLSASAASSGASTTSSQVWRRSDVVCHDSWCNSNSSVRLSERV